MGEAASKLHVAIFAQPYAVIPGGRVRVHGVATSDGATAAYGVPIRLSVPAGRILPKRILTDAQGEFEVTFEAPNVQGPVTVEARPEDPHPDSQVGYLVVSVTSGASQPADIAGAALHEILKDELATARSNTSTIEQRGINLIATSATLATILLALMKALGDVTKTPFALPPLAKIAAGAFATSALLAIISNYITVPPGVDAKAIMEGPYLEDDQWYRAYWRGVQTSSLLLATKLCAIQRTNRIKAVMVLLGGVVQVVAVIFVVLAVMV